MPRCSLNAFFGLFRRWQNARLSWLACAWAAIGAGLLLGGGRSALAQGGGQNYIVPPVDEELQRQRFDISRILRNQRFENDAEREKFDQYYSRFAFPRWAQPDSHNRLPTFRKELRNDLRTGQTGAPHDRLNGLTLSYMQKVAKHPRVHPAVRINAMLMIGELNQSEAIRPGELPVPWPQALPVLIETLRATDQLEAVRAAAMVGLHYHARFGKLSDAARAELIETMIPMASSADPPAGLSPDGYLWLRVRAVEILGLLGTAGQNGDVARAITKVLATAKEPMLLRCAAAESLGRLSYAGTSNLDVPAMAKALGQLAADAIREELDARSESADAFSRSRLKHRLLCVQYGLVGSEDDADISGIAAASGSADARQLIDRYAQPVAEAIAALDDRRESDETVVGTLETALGRLTPGEG